MALADSSREATQQHATARASRGVVKVVLNIEQSEGKGALVRRSIGTRELRNLSPFLMLDHFKTLQGAGFPDHPHRGIATLTYMLHGYSLHEDFLGNRGKLGPGDLQFMIAGKGIVHSEIPLIGADNIPPEGLQLWIDLPSEKKMVAPSYQNMKAAQVPIANPSTGVEIKVVCGETDGNSEQGIVSSPVRPLGGCWFFDVTFSTEEAQMFQRIPHGWTAFLYTYVGDIKVGNSTIIRSSHTAVLSNEEDKTGVLLSSQSQNSRFFVIAGEPLNQPIVQHGPFVVDSPEKIQEAFFDYSLGQNGFEGAHTWESKIKALMDEPEADVGQHDYD